jgi:hypothetical protein
VDYVGGRTPRITNALALRGGMLRFMFILHSGGDGAGRIISRLYQRKQHSRFAA